MAIEGFDYKGFAESMSKQAKDIVPKEISGYNKKYLVKIIYNYVLLAGESLYNDDELVEVDAELAVFMCQVLAEWTYHKTVDLIRAGIPSEYWDFVMQKIAHTIFESIKQGIRENMEEQKLLDIAEHFATKVYQEAIAELNEDGKISDELLKNAYNQSNIDKMAQETSESKVSSFLRGSNFARIIGIIAFILQCYIKHIPMRFLTYIDNYSIILFSILMFILAMVTVLREKFNLENILQVKKYIIEIALILIAVDFSANVLKLLLGYPNGEIGTLIASVLYILTLLMQNNIENETV